MEKKIIKRIKAGDWDAFSLLYNQYADYALRVGMAVTRSRAKCRCSSGFIRVYRNIDKFDIDKPSNPWFYKILINECRITLTRYLPMDEILENDTTFQEDKYRFQMNIAISIVKTNSSLI